MTFHEYKFNFLKDEALSLIRKNLFELQFQLDDPFSPHMPNFLVVREQNPV